jgi:hypothetical protein
MSTYTTHYSLDKYEGSDRPNLRDQYNAAMDKIDAQLYEEANDIAGQNSRITSIQQTQTQQAARMTTIETTQSGQASSIALLNAFMSQPYTKSTTTVTGAEEGHSYTQTIDRYVIGDQGLQVYIVRGLANNVSLIQSSQMAGMYHANLSTKNVHAWPVPFTDTPATLVSVDLTTTLSVILNDVETDPNYQYNNRAYVPGVGAWHVRDFQSSSHNVTWTVVAIGNYAV